MKIQSVATRKLFPIRMKSDDKNWLICKEKNQKVQEWMTFLTISFVYIKIIKKKKENIMKWLANSLALLSTLLCLKFHYLTTGAWTSFELNFDEKREKDEINF